MIKTINNVIKNLDPYDFTLLLTIFFIITHFQEMANQTPFLFIPLVLISAIGFLFKESRQSKIFWMSETIFYGIWVILNWQTIDNHMYLWGFCLLAITCSLFSHDKFKALQISAKGLILCCMTYAVFQKLNPNFLSGDFFYFTLITDPRFNFIGPLIQYNLMDVITENESFLNELMSNSKTVLLNPGPFILNPISKIISWYVIIIESLIVICFLFPRQRLYQWQHWLLLLFLSTYFILPIKGFAFTLITLGFCLIKKEDINLKYIYLAFIIYIFSFSGIIVDTLFKATYPIL